MKTLAIMQPYFFPYIGYFQLLNAVENFVLYDNLQYTKKGWINRNRILVNGQDDYISIPLKKDSDYLNIVDRELATTDSKDKTKIVRKIENAYRKAPYFKDNFNILSELILIDEVNLFQYLYKILLGLKNYLNIKTNIVISSEVNIDHTLSGQDKVLAICKKLNTDIYYNPIGGMELYSKSDFLLQGIILKFLKTSPFSYMQLGNDFVPALSIIDVLMFNPRDKINAYLCSSYELI